jgi:hypothetical protein
VDTTLTNSLNVSLVSANVNTVGSYVGYATYSTTDVTGVGGGAYSGGTWSGYLYFTIPDNQNSVSL